MTEGTQKMETMMKSIEEMSVLELSGFVKALEDKFGVSAAAPVAVAGGAAVEGDAPAAEEKTAFDVVLTEVGGQKIQVIKEIRSLTELSLKEAKELTDNVPKAIKTGVPKDEAEEIQKAIEKAGGKAEIK